MQAVIDVTTDRFDADVVERSRTVPVVVDFWAAWCGPCRVLGPILEEAVRRRDGQVVLAKVDVDREPALAARFGVRGIPTVVGFRDGAPVASFTGAVPAPEVDRFLDQLIPSEADRLAARGEALAAADPAAARAAFEEALTLDPRHRRAAVGLARLLVEEDPDRALELVAPHRPDPDAEAVAARAELRREGVADVEALRRHLATHPDDARARLLLGRAMAAEGRYEEAIGELLAAARDREHREEARQQLVAVFRILGDDHPAVGPARRELARLLY